MKVILALSAAIVAIVIAPAPVVTTKAINVDLYDASTKIGEFDFTMRKHTGIMSPYFEIDYGSATLTITNVNYLWEGETQAPAEAPRVNMLSGNESQVVLLTESGAPEDGRFTPTLTDGQWEWYCAESDWDSIWDDPTGVTYRIAYYDGTSIHQVSN